MCWFNNHRYGKIAEDGFQYCEKCGLAAPCKHVWENKKKITYEGKTKFNSISGTKSRDWEDNLISQQCKVCGDLRSVWEFGHDF